MSEHIVTKEKMQSLRALAEVNLKVSEALTTLSGLKKEETEYFETRENEALEKIREVLAESKDLLKECDENHAQIQEFSVEVTDFASKLTIMHQWLKDLVKDFNERNELWSKELEKQRSEIQEKRNQIKAEKQIIENDRKSLDMAKKVFAGEQKKLDSDRGTVERAIERLKNNRI